MRSDICSIDYTAPNPVNRGSISGFFNQFSVEFSPRKFSLPQLPLENPPIHLIRFTLFPIVARLNSIKFNPVALFSLLGVSLNYRSATTSEREREREESLNCAKKILKLLESNPLETLPSFILLCCAVSVINSERLPPPPPPSLLKYSICGCFNYSNDKKPFDGISPLQSLYFHFRANKPH